MHIRQLLKLTLMIFCISILLGGCAQRKTQYSSSVVDYLYPNKDSYIETASIPHLNLPLNVGIAFVPSSRGNNVLTEIDKFKLMNKVSENFKKYDFIKSIEIIPSAYLTQQGSFTNLNQIQKMYGIDVIALVSYDQTQFSDETFASITYWTLIGAYIIPGEKNDTHTMVDVTVYDIKSQKMLFRAPGINRTKSKATPINLTEQLRKDRTKSFEEASIDLIKNLELQLSVFKEKIKSSPKNYIIENKQGYTGGGSIDTLFTLLLLSIGSAALFFKKRS